MAEPEIREKWPRHYEADLTEAWVRGEPTAPILARMPDNFRSIASAHARVFCEQIKYHRRMATPIEQIAGPRLAEWVSIYCSRISSK